MPTVDDLREALIALAGKRRRSEGEPDPFDADLCLQLLFADLSPTRRSEPVPSPSGHCRLPDPALALDAQLEALARLPELPPEIQVRIVKEIERGGASPLSTLAEIWRDAYEMWASRRLRKLKFPADPRTLEFPRSRRTLALARLAFAPEWTLLTSLSDAEGSERMNQATSAGDGAFFLRLPGSMWTMATLRQSPGSMWTMATLRQSPGYLDRWDGALSGLALAVSVKRRDPIGGKFTVSAETQHLGAYDRVDLLFYARARRMFVRDDAYVVANELEELSKALFWNATPSRNGKRSLSRTRPTAEMLAWKDKMVLTRAEVVPPGHAPWFLEATWSPERTSSTVTETLSSRRSWNERTEGALAGTLSPRRLWNERAEEALADARETFPNLKKLAVPIDSANELVLFEEGEAAADPKAKIWDLWRASFRSGVEPTIAALKEDPAWGYDLDSNLTGDIAGGRRTGLLILPAPIYFWLRDSARLDWFVSRAGVIRFLGGTMVVALPGDDQKTFAPFDIVWLDDAAGPEEMSRLTLTPRGASVLSL
jgi:hypothetical protein